MPARRPGVSAQKSASQRLCAFSPSQRSSCSPALGGRAVRLLDGKNGGMVLGYSNSAARPSRLVSSRRRAESQLRYAVSPRRSAKGFTNVLTHSSNSSWYSLDRYSR